MIKIGVIGYSEGNGHPFSFSSIINGYSDEGFIKANWPVIHNYLRNCSPADFGFEGILVTHAWTQDKNLTSQLCDACLIENPCDDIEDVVKAVDAVLIARDDWESHMDIALPFLEHGKFVFVDKPLSIDPKQLSFFEPYLRSGHLMSTSGLRYARELDPMRADCEYWETGTPVLITGTVLNGLEKYGIHMIEAISGLGISFEGAINIRRLNAEHESYSLLLDSGAQFLLNCLGNVGKTFHLDIFGKKEHFHVDIHDNFSAFRRTLAMFIKMIRTETPPINPDETLRILKMIILMKKLEVGEEAILN